MSGYKGDLSPEQEKALQQIKEYLSEQLEKGNGKLPELLANEDEDSMILRFLRARSFDVEKSAKLLTDCLIWRRDFQGIGVNQITKESIVNEYPIGKCFYHGEDLEGRPIVYVRVRLHNKNDSDPEEVQRICVFMFEEARKLLKPPVDRCSVLFDLSQFSYQNMDYSFCRFLIDMFATKYPESLGVCLIVNCPFIFWACWKVISPWIDPITAKKVKFVSLEKLEEFISSDQLLNEYGGTNDFCWEKVNHQ